MTNPNIGVHLSLGRDPGVSVAQARLRGAGCIQIFASSPGAWKPPVLRPAWVEALAQARREQSIAPLFIHAIYLVNLASANEDLRARSCGSLIATLRAGREIGARGVVTHIGSHAGLGFDAVADRVAESLRRVLEETPDNVLLLLENSAGAGGIIGSSLDELADLIDRAGSPGRLGVTLDTAHLCGAGWDFGEEDASRRLVDEVQARFGLNRLALIHANDSKVPPGSRRDRHAIVGTGHVGLEGFRQLLRQPALTAVPWILETPDLDAALPEEERFVSLTALRNLACEASRFATDTTVP